MFGWKQKPHLGQSLLVKEIDARLKFLEETQERLGKNINIIAGRVDTAQKNISTSFDRLNELEVKVAYLIMIFTAVADGFNKAMEGLANDQN